MTYALFQSQTSTIEDPQAFGALKIDNTLTLKSFKKGFKIDIIEVRKQNMGVAS